MPHEWDPEVEREFAGWEERVRKDLVPKLDQSVVVASIVPRGEPDIKYAVELGLSIMLDKPILAVVQPGVEVPAKLLRVADKVLEVDLDDTPAASAALQAALAEMVGAEPV